MMLVEVSYGFMFDTYHILIESLFTLNVIQIGSYTIYFFLYFGSSNFKKFQFQSLIINDISRNVTWINVRYVSHSG